MQQFVMIPVREEVKKKLPICKEIYLKHHPEMRNMRITYNKIIAEVVRYYIETEKASIF
jgi:hypothetical protein